MFIDVWYDQYTNSWVTQLKDQEENQIQDADYVHSKKEAVNYAYSLQRENTAATIRIYTRQGELQREVKEALK